LFAEQQNAQQSANACPQIRLARHTHRAKRALQAEEQHKRRASAEHALDRRCIQRFRPRLEPPRRIDQCCHRNERQRRP